RHPQASRATIPAHAPLPQPRRRSAAQRPTPRHQRPTRNREDHPPARGHRRYRRYPRHASAARRPGKSLYRPAHIHQRKSRLLSHRRNCIRERRDRGCQQQQHRDRKYLARTAPAKKRLPCGLPRRGLFFGYRHEYLRRTGMGAGQRRTWPLEQPQQPDEAGAHFAETAAELTGLLKDFERFRTLASAYHDALLAGQKPAESAAQRLLAEYNIPAAYLPGPYFVSLPPTTIHKLTPYSSEKLNTLRSTIFLRSLELHEWAIRANAVRFQANLSAFVDMLAGRYREQIDESVAAVLWSSFFFCIPVVSVTLASFHRQFGRLGQGNLGWLLLDEAG